jgi:hypothetical protein
MMAAGGAYVQCLDALISCSCVRAVGASAIGCCWRGCWLRWVRSWVKIPVVRRVLRPVAANTSTHPYAHSHTPSQTVTHTCTHIMIIIITIVVVVVVVVITTCVVRTLDQIGTCPGTWATVVDSSRVHLGHRATHGTLTATRSHRGATSLRASWSAPRVDRRSSQCTQHRCPAHCSTTAKQAARNSSSSSSSSSSRGPGSIHRSQGAQTETASP